MGEDLSQGAKIGIILIILCALIAIVFSIMSIMKNITTQGTEDLQKSLSSISMQKFDDYDQREITGAQVISACKLFQDQPFAVVVYTNRSTAPTTYGLSNISLTTSTYSYDTSSKVLLVPSGYVKGSLPSSTFTFNNNRKNMSTKTNNAYVSNSARFFSYLIKTSAGDIIGIMVDEV